MSKIANGVFACVIILFFNSMITLANDVIEFKYSFSDKFYYAKNPLGEKEDLHVEKLKEAVEMACRLWEKATGGNIIFSLADNQEEADIIFEGWWEKGPKISTQNGKICINEYGDQHLFSEYMPEAYSFTIFEDCNTECEYPETGNPANASTDHRARIFFHIQNVLDKTVPWFCVSDKNKVHFIEAERDVTRVAAQEIGHALGFCGYPDKNAQDCVQTRECNQNNASVMCKKQAHCYQEDQESEVPLGGMDDIDRMGVRDLTVFDKERIVKKFFPGTKTLYGKVKDADDNPIPNAVVATVSGNLTAKTDNNGIYSLWGIPPGTFTENGRNPETGQTIGEIITITSAAPDIILKDFKFRTSSQPVPMSSLITPSSGTPYDSYSLQTTFPGVYQEQPAALKLFIDNKEVHTFSIRPDGHQPVYALSYYSLTGFDLGLHNYELKVFRKKGDWQQILSGSFFVGRPSKVQFDLESNPTTVSVGKNKHTKITASLKNDKGIPLGGRTIIFRTSFPGYFTPSDGKAVTNSHGEAEIMFTPVSGGHAKIMAIPPYGPSASATITCTSPTATISFELSPVDDNSYEVTSEIDYLSDDRSTAGESIKWRLAPAADFIWTNGPDHKIEGNGKAKGVFSVGKAETTRVTVTATHVPTGISGTGTFTLGGPDSVLTLPLKNLGKSVERCEWSSNGYVGVSQRSGSGLSIYRVSDWKKVWYGKHRLGKNHSFFFSPNGRKLVTSAFGDNNKTAIVNALNGSIQKSWNMIVDGEPYTADSFFGWQGDDIYAVHNDYSIRKWSTSGNLQMTFSHNAEIGELQFNPSNDSQFAAVDKHGELRIWNTDSSSPVKTVKVESIPTGNLKCLAWSHDGANLSAGSGIADTGVIYTFDTLSWSKSGFDLPDLGNVNSLDYNIDSSRLAIGHDNGLIVYNTDNYAVEYYNKGSVHHVRWSPDSSMLAADGQVYLFDKLNFDCPKIIVYAPQNGSSLITDSIEIAGKIPDRRNIRSATVAVNKSSPIALSLAFDGSFAQTVPLEKDQNTILIRVKNVQQNASTITLTVKRLADSLPPILTEPFVDPGSGLKGSTFNLSIRAHAAISKVDTSKVSADIRSSNGNLVSTVQLYDDGSHGDMNPGDGVYGTLWASEEAGEGLHAIDFYAVDTAGNSEKLANTSEFFVYDKPNIKKPYISPPSPFLNDPVTVNAEITDISGVKSADLFYSKNGGSSWSILPMSDTGSGYTGTISEQRVGTVYYKIKAVDVHGNTNESNAHAYNVRDSNRPVITIQQPEIVSKTFTSEPLIVVSGHAIDAGGVGLKSVTCNTEDPNTGTLEEWSFNVTLNKGMNRITVVAEDQNGKLASDSIEITYAPKLVAPVFSPTAPHPFTEPVPVSIKSSVEGATIHYTTDNTEPSKASKTFTSPILIKETTTIKARVFMSGRTPSAVVVGTYTLTPLKKTKSQKILTLQVAAFKDKKFANEMITRLKEKGYPAYSIVVKSSDGVTYYKVRIGSFENRAEAESTLKRIKKDKMEAIVVVINKDGS